MKINADITIISDRDGVRIEIRDRDASVMMIKLDLSSKQFTSAIGRLAHTEVRDCEVYGLDKIGKRQETDTLEFCLDVDKWVDKTKNQARKKVIENCPEGWEPDMNFGSQDSFFNKDGKEWARTTIRRWV